MRASQTIGGRRGRAAFAGTALCLIAAAMPVAAAAQSAAPPAGEPLQIAYLSFAVANTYDKPMLDAAKAAAAAGNAVLTVLDANNNPADQSTQLQDAVTSGRYDGIITQPIVGAQLATDVAAAIAKHIPVANLDQILGADMTTSASQVDGLSANVVFIPSEIGRKMGDLTVKACADAAADPCNVGYIYAFKGYPLDTAIKTAFDAAIAGTPSVKIVAEGEGHFNPADGLTAGQDMLQGHSDINVIVGSDQAITGAIQAAQGASLADKIRTVGYGGGAVAVADIAAGNRYATVMQLPATEGRLAVENLLTAIASGTPVAGVDPVSLLPDSGIVTKDNAASFTPEWPG